jgi:hypothetical protein
MANRADFFYFDPINQQTQYRDVDVDDESINEDFYFPQFWESEQIRLLKDVRQNEIGEYECELDIIHSLTFHNIVDYLIAAQTAKSGYPVITHSRSLKKTTHGSNGFHLQESAKDD